MAMLATPTAEEDFHWEPQRAVAAMYLDLLRDLMHRHAQLRELEQSFLLRTGTRLFDWVDHFVVPEPPVESISHENGETVQFEKSTFDGLTAWSLHAGMFPRMVLVNHEHHGKLQTGIALKVESVDDYLAANGLADRVAVVGTRGGQLRTAQISVEHGIGVWIVERHGYDSFIPPEVTSQEVIAAHKHYQKFLARNRSFEDAHAGFLYAQELIHEAQEEIGVDWACERFFAAERAYWMSRNEAGRAQYRRQQALGLGWGNHDHHTYRSSRESFQDLITTLEMLGFHCRERFYAGHQAGWGAQVLEQTVCGLCVFADVDLSPEEVAGDFAHQPLDSFPQLKTVGLWCALHGEAFLQAGMHHLEAQFAFDQTIEQLKKLDVPSMAPFTNFTFLRQAFTKGEIWRVDPKRLERLTAQGKITPEQAVKFATEGALGSHLEILERNDGYKGFNQTGISDIIHRTDPRLA